MAMASQSPNDKTMPTGRFIICAEQSNEWLAREEDVGHAFSLHWSERPEEAIHYDSPDEAATIAKRISLSKARHMTVYEIPSRSGKVALRPVISFGGSLPESPPSDLQVE